MENNPLFIFSRFCLFLSFTLHVWIAISPFTKPTVSSLPNQSLVIRLIHRDSILSPLYRNDFTVSDRGDFIIKSSEERVAYLSGKAKSAIHPTVIGDLVPNYTGSIFFVNVTIGEPGVPQLLIIDTGSAMFWVQCAKCSTCWITKNPRYKPSKSSTYAPIACHPAECQHIYRGHCDSEGYCEYLVQYGDKTNSSGTVAYEKFTFPTYDKGTSVLHSLIFGCGTKHNDIISQSNGVFGLSGGLASVIAQIGSKFSYCISSIRDPTDLSHFLALGNDVAIVDGFKTPFEFSLAGMYLVTLVSVGIGYEKNITADPKEFEFSVIFDSGSSLTYLAKSLYEPVKSEVMAQLEKSGLHPVPPPTGLGHRNALCYKGDMDSLPDIPVVLYLPGIAMDLNRETLFFQAQKSVFCMAIVEKIRVNVIGVINQQFSNIGFDLENKLISYKNTDCLLSAKSL